MQHCTECTDLMYDCSIALLTQLLLLFFGHSCQQFGGAADAMARCSVLLLCVYVLGTCVCALYAYW